ncbi:MAG: SHOCT domain-containing protein [Solirubrobacterales bacterium]
MPLANFDLGEALVTVLAIFLLFAWIWVLIAIFGDLFADPDVSGWGKAGWSVLLIFLPWLGVLIYLIARGGAMRERTVARQQEAQAEMDNYVRKTAGGSTAEELDKLSALKDKGVISDEEFQRQKDKLLD